MTNNKYNQLREEIILAVPEIIELKKGCKIITDKWSFHNTTEIIINRCSDLKDFDCAYRSERIKKEEIVEILGRDITLEDCLIAGFKSLPKMNLGNPKNAEIYKKYEKFVTDITLQESQWKPNIPLQDQSDECKELLWDLICKK